MLVPMLAPMMMPIAWKRVIMPELTKPTTITVVAEEDCMTEVTPAPRSSPLSGVLVTRYRKDSSLSPATRFKPSPISDMPYINSATPQRRLSIITTVFMLTLLNVAAREADQILARCLIDFSIFLNGFL